MPQPPPGRPESILRATDLSPRCDPPARRHHGACEKMSALMTLDYLKERAGRGSQARFARVLAKVKDRRPVPGDDRAKRVTAR